MKLLSRFLRRRKGEISVFGNQHTKATFRYRVGFIRDGKRHFVTPWRDNLILDSGLNMHASTGWATCFATCIFGNQVSPTPVSRGPGAITFSQTLTTITSSGNFFVPADTGRLFKFDTGEEAYLTYTSATTATASISRTVGSGPGTVWYVNQTAVESVFAYSTGYDPTGGANGTSAVGNVLTMQRTYTGAAVGAPATLTEIGFNSGASNVNIFDRDIIVGGVSLLTGDIPLAVAQLILTLSGSTPTAVGNVTTGFDSSGNSQVVTPGLDSAGGGQQIDWVQSTGNGTGVGAGGMEPNGMSGGFQALTATFAIPAFTTGFVASFGTPIASTTLANGTYTAGNFYRDATAVWNITTANGVIYGFSAGGGNRAAWCQKLTTTFTKLSTQQLTLVFRRSWQRILVN